MIDGHWLKTWRVNAMVDDVVVPVTGFAGVMVTPGAARMIAWNLFLLYRPEVAR